MSRFKSIWETKLPVAIAVVSGAAGVLYNIDLPAMFGLLIFTEQFLIFLLYATLALIFLTSAPANVRSVRTWISGGLALLCAIVAAITITKYPDWVKTSGYLEPIKLIVGGLSLVLLLEGIRRQTGLFLVLVVIVGALYAAFAAYMPGPLRTVNTAWDRIVLYLFFDNNSMLGLPLWVGATMAFGFVVLGYVLEVSGAGDTLNRFAIRALGRYRGGPAYGAVLASAQFGGFTGSVAADVYVSGTFTIPLMKRVGYRPPVAAAVEASASTGAGIMPPVMDPGAFLLAQTVGIPYPKVALAAILPALLYYAGIFMAIFGETKHDPLIKRLDASDLPEVSRSEALVGWSVLIVTLTALIYTLFILYLNPALAALYSAIPALVLVLVRKGVRTIPAILHGAVVRLQDLIPICAGAGLVIGVLSLTGLGTSFSQWAMGFSTQSPTAIIAITVLVTLVLGCAMPPFVVYAVSGLVLAPPLIAIGASPLAAHLFILYWALFAQFTPPVCIAAIVAASIARTNPWVTAMHTIRIGFPAFIIPFMFLFDPALLLNGTVADVIVVTARSFVGLAAFVLGFSALFYADVARLRVLGAVRMGLAVAVLYPSTIANIAAVFLLCALWAFEKYRFNVQSA